MQAWQSVVQVTIAAQAEYQQRSIGSTGREQRSSCLRCILRHANRRMKNMSRGQYELVRASAADNKRSQTGLELNVPDYVNDTERPLASLSVGEAFLASFSLAWVCPMRSRRRRAM